MLYRFANALDTGTRIHFHITPRLKYTYPISDGFILDYIATANTSINTKIDFNDIDLNTFIRCSLFDFVQL